MTTATTIVCMLQGQQMSERISKCNPSNMDKGKQEHIYNIHSHSKLLSTRAQITTQSHQAQKHITEEKSKEELYIRRQQAQQ